MKTSQVNPLRTAAGLMAVLALSVTAAFGQVPEKGSAKGGAMLLMKPRPVVNETSNYQPMSCPECKDEVLKTKDWTARGANKPYVTIVRHLCKGCGNDWVVTGHGKAKASVAVHKCTSCGSEDAACCNTKKGSAVATKGMEKDIKVAP